MLELEPLRGGALQRDPQIVSDAGRAWKLALGSAQRRCCRDSSIVGGGELHGAVTLACGGGPVDESSDVR